MKFIFSASVALTTGWLETREHLGVLETGRGPPRWPLIGPGCNQDPPSEGQPEPFLSLEDGALGRPGGGREGQPVAGPALSKPTYTFTPWLSTKVVYTLYPPKSQNPL